MKERVLLKTIFSSLSINYFMPLKKSLHASIQMCISTDVLRRCSLHIYKIMHVCRIFFLLNGIWRKKLQCITTWLFCKWTSEENVFKSVCFKYSTYLNISFCHKEFFLFFRYVCSLMCELNMSLFLKSITGIILVLNLLS